MIKGLKYIVDTVMENSSIIRYNIISLFTVQLRKKCEHQNKSWVLVKWHKPDWGILDRTQFDEKVINNVHSNNSGIFQLFTIF